MPALVAAQRVGAPAVLVIGEVVTLHPDYVVAYAESLTLTC